MFAWYDMWVGAFWESQKRRLYVFPVPCLGVRIDFGSHQVPSEQSGRVAELESAMDAIWRLTNLPFNDTDRYRIQQIAFAYINGGSPKPGSGVHQWLWEHGHIPIGDAEWRRR